MTNQMDKQLKDLFDKSPAIATLRPAERKSLFEQIIESSDESKKKYIEMFLTERQREEKYEQEMENLLIQLKNSLNKLKSAENKLAEAENNQNEKKELDKLTNELEDI